MLIDEFIFGNTALQTIIEDYVHAQAVSKLLPIHQGPSSLKA
jgi:succinate dehydrogenase hydrophobic anchor subunit